MNIVCHATFVGIAHPNFYTFVIKHHLISVYEIGLFHTEWKICSLDDNPSSPAWKAPKPSADLLLQHGRPCSITLLGALPSSVHTGKWQIMVIHIPKSWKANTGLIHAQACPAMISSCSPLPPAHPFPLLKQKAWSQQFFFGEKQGVYTCLCMAFVFPSMGKACPGFT